MLFRSKDYSHYSKVTGSGRTCELTARSHWPHLGSKYLEQDRLRFESWVCINGQLWAETKQSVFPAAKWAWEQLPSGFLQRVHERAHEALSRLGKLGSLEPLPTWGGHHRAQYRFSLVKLHVQHSCVRSSTFTSTSFKKLKIISFTFFYCGKICVT